MALGELADGVGEVGFRVEAIQLGGFDEGIEDGGAVAACVRDASIMLLLLRLRMIELWLVAGRYPTGVVRVAIPNALILSGSGRRRTSRCEPAPKPKQPGLRSGSRHRGPVPFQPYRPAH